MNRGCCRSSQESDESFDVLSSGGEEELLLDELQPTQSQTTEANAALQFREQRLDLLSLALCILELWCCPEITRSLPSSFVHMDGKISEGAGGALRPLRTRATFLARSDIAEGPIPFVAAAII